MSFFQRLTGDKVRAGDYTDEFIEYYNEHNKKRDSLKKGVCYKRVKLTKEYLKELNEEGGDLETSWQDGYGEERKTVGTIQSAKLVDSVYSNGQPYTYYFIKFSNGTVTYRPNDVFKKWFVPCPSKAGTRSARKQRRMKTRRLRK